MLFQICLSFSFFISILWFPLLLSFLAPFKHPEPEQTGELPLLTDEPKITNNRTRGREGSRVRRVYTVDDFLALLLLWRHFVDNVRVEVASPVGWIGIGF